MSVLAVFAALFYNPIDVNAYVLQTLLYKNEKIIRQSILLQWHVHVKIIVATNK